MTINSLRKIAIRVVGSQKAVCRGGVLGGGDSLRPALAKKLGRFHLNKQTRYNSAHLYCLHGSTGSVSQSKSSPRKKAQDPIQKTTEAKRKGCLPRQHKTLSANPHTTTHQKPGVGRCRIALFSDFAFFCSFLSVHAPLLSVSLSLTQKVHTGPWPLAPKAILQCSPKSPPHLTASSNTVTPRTNSSANSSFQWHHPSLVSK